MQCDYLHLYHTHDHILYIDVGPTEVVQCIQIKEGEIGHSYARVFQSCLDEYVEWVEVQDPYIRARHQVHNFVRFCELLLKKCKRLKEVQLKTGSADEQVSSKKFSCNCLPSYLVSSYSSSH